MRVQVGADWDKDKCVVAWRIHGKEHHGRVMRNHESVAAFVDRLQEDAGNEEALELEVGIEPGDRFWCILWEAAGAKVWIFDGGKTHNYMKSLDSSNARDDLRSAKALLGMLQSTEHRNAANTNLGPEMRALTCSLAAKNEATRLVTKLLNQLGAFLRQYHPALRNEGKILRAHWFLNALELAPTAAAWNEADEATRENVLKGSRQPMRSEVLELLGRDLGAVDPQEETAVRTRIRGVVMVLRVALQAEKAAQDVLETLLEESGVMREASAVEGVGAVLTAGLAIAFGTSRSRAASGTAEHRDAAAVVLGAVPVTQRSGTIGDASPKATHRRSTSPLLRAIPYVLGLQLMMRHAWAKAAYAHYKAHGKSTASAFRSITRSFLRIVGAMMRDQSTFDEVRYVAALKAKGVPWAMSL